MSLFEPTSIAIIGASTTEGKVGHDILKNLVEQGYEGNIIPVNPKADEILGQKAYPTISDIPDEVEMAVVVIPAKFVPDVCKECGEKGVKHLVIITAGFSEVHTEEGAALEEEILEHVKEYDMNLIGPNCLGILRPKIKMNASFAKDMPAVGNVAMISQSGAMAVALMDASPAYHIGYSLVASIGNKAQLDECDYLEICEQDDETKVIGFYLESITDGQRFLEIAGRVSKTKHIVLLKSGVSEHGKEAASSHTGSLAGNDAAIDAACKQAGIHRAHSAGEFLDLVRVLSAQPPLLSPNVAIITNAGGPGILATDACEKEGLLLPHFSEKTLESFKESLPSTAGTVNPVDVIGDAKDDRYAAALQACCDDPKIDGAVVILTPQVMTPVNEIAQIIVDISKKNSLMPVTTSFMGSENVEEARALLRKNGVPTFETPERAVRALAMLRSTGVEMHRRCVSTTTDDATSEHAASAQALLADHHGLLSEDLTEHLFSLYDLEMPKQAVAEDADQAVALAEKIGYPVVAKISSPDILHKTDVGGIRVNLKNEADVRDAFDGIMQSVNTEMPDADVQGILIQQFLPIGEEFIIGSLRDPNFGPLIMVGLGGIYTELFKDTSFRIAPVNEQESYEMLQELTAWKLLLGMRGKEQSDIDNLARVVQTVSQIVHDCPQISELDINPILVGEEGVVIADVKIVTS